MRATVRRVRVWIEAWEWQCCGDPFKLGSNVMWGLLPASAHLRSALAVEFGEGVAQQLTHYETHHEIDGDPETVPTRGRVEAIDAAFCVLEARPDNARFYEPIAGSGVLESRQSADGWEPEDEPGGKRYRRFSGYIVTLDPLD
jgi:hypothetical protein